MKVPVLLPNIFDYPFTYENKNKSVIKPGDFVKVPFGKKEITGLVWDHEQKTQKKIKIKNISKKLDVPRLSLKTIKFIKWFSRYNMVPLGMSLKMFLINKSIVEKKNHNEFKKYQLIHKIKNVELNLEQKKTLLALKNFGKKYSVNVIEGVTGSGKTIVYFERIKDFIFKDYQALIMLPEIALTNQFSKRFKDFFGTYPAIWHSGMSQKEKKVIWRGVIENKIKLVIGARSSLFLPFKKLGVIVVDEEHDSSYKQDEGIIYNARDMAITKSYLENIPINLVTAVPSVETYNNIISKKYNLTTLKKRYREAALPKFQIINLKKNMPKKGEWISQEAVKYVKNHLDVGDQVLFFLNRRGYAPFVICKRCSFKFECPNCTVNLIFHEIFNQLICHHCGYKADTNRKCDDGKNCDILMCGPGVERIYKELKEKFSSKKIEIFSSDLINKNRKISQFIDDIESKKVDIIVGTQLISKGFHFPKLNCIVVVDSDLSSHGYDLRASEKNIQLYHQLIGRAGREGNNSSIYFQTYSPQDEILLNISKNDPSLFLKSELKLRKEKKLPPFFRLISIIISSKNEKLANSFSTQLKNNLPKIKNVDILGPVTAPIYKIRKKYRYRLLIRYPKNLFIQKYLKQHLKNIKVLPGIKLGVDVDPINFS